MNEQERMESLEMLIEDLEAENAKYREEAVALEKERDELLVKVQTLNTENHEIKLELKKLKKDKS